MNLQQPEQTDHMDAAAGDSAMRRQAMLTLAALGVVFGDIGTSPLYAFRESLLSVRLVPDQARAVLGVVSLIFWSLMIVVTVKYVTFIMRADNNGEGGVLGLALFYGDGLLTPAISVLSAVEGIAVDNRAFEPLVLPLTVAIVIGLFLLQSRGTARVGGLFGPIMVVWFAVLGVLGLFS